MTRFRRRHNNYSPNQTSTFDDSFLGAIAQYHASFNAIKKSLRLRSIINNYKNDEKKKKRRNYPPLINESAPASSRLPIPTTCLVFARVCVFFLLFFFPLSLFSYLLTYLRCPLVPWHTATATSSIHNDYLNSQIPRNIYSMENNTENIANKAEDNTER